MTEEEQAVRRGVGEVVDAQEAAQPALQAVNVQMTSVCRHGLQPDLGAFAEGGGTDFE